MQQAKDLLTQELFFRRRRNQKFARPQNRIRYNNNKSQKKRSEKAFIDAPLDKNRTIIGKILAGKSELTISKDYLLGSGFTFNLYNYQKNVDGLIYSGIYEYGVAKLNETTYKIKKLQDG